MKLLRGWFGPKWEYGRCGPKMCHARRHRRKGNVQFVLWKAGEQGHNTEYWHDFDRSWWPTFEPYETAE